jgi:hypothetical protein
MREMLRADLVQKKSLKNGGFEPRCVLRCWILANGGELRLTGRGSHLFLGGGLWAI